MVSLVSNQCKYCDSNNDVWVIKRRTNFYSIAALLWGWYLILEDPWANTKLPHILQEAQGSLLAQTLCTTGQGSSPRSLWDEQVSPTILQLLSALQNPPPSPGPFEKHMENQGKGWCLCSYTQQLQQGQGKGWARVHGVKWSGWGFKILTWERCQGQMGISAVTIRGHPDLPSTRWCENPVYCTHKLIVPTLFNWELQQFYFRLLPCYSLSCLCLVLLLIIEVQQRCPWGNVGNLGINF